MRNIARWPRRCLVTPEDRLTPGSVFGDVLSATIPAQFGGSAPDAVPSSTSLTLVDLPPETAPAPAIDPGATYTTRTTSAADALAAVAVALVRPANTPLDPALTDELFSTPTPPPAPTPAVPDAAPPDAAPSGGSAVSLVTLPGAPGTPPPPTAHDDSYFVLAGRLSLPAFGVLSNDSNACGSALQASLATGPQHGTLAFQTDGSFDYTPAAGYVGADSFAYRASAGGKSAGPVLVSLGVTDAAPNAPDSDYSDPAGQALTGDIGQIATDPDPGDGLTFVLDAGPGHGTATLDGTGHFNYTPAVGFAGDDTFRYHTNDGALDSPSGTISIHVEGHPPVAVDIGYDVQAGGTLAADPSRNLTTDAAYDLDGYPLTAAPNDGPTHAAAFALNADGTFSYTPQPGFTGADGFTFHVNGGGMGSNTATVSLNVSGGPVAHDDTYVMNDDGSVTVAAAGSVLLNDTSGGGNLTARLVAAPASGTLAFSADGSFKYLQAIGQPILDKVTFTYRAVAGGGAERGDRYGAVHPPDTHPTDHPSEGILGHASRRRG